MRQHTTHMITILPQLVKYPTLRAAAVHDDAGILNQSELSKVGKFTRHLW